MTSEPVAHPALESAIRETIESVRHLATHDPVAAARRAGDLVRRLGVAAEEASEIRAVAARAARSEEHLSIAALAELLGMSKTRAAQIIRPVGRLEE